MLRTGCLNFWEVLAQSIAMLGPTMTPVLIVPLAFASSGNASWLAYVFGAVMLLAVALCLREFASRSATAGSLYTYTQRAFGPRGAVLAGWSLLWAYGFVCVAGLTGFAVFSRALLGPLGAAIPSLVFVAFCLGVGWYISYYDIRLSTITLLALETASVSLITLLIVIVFAHRGIVDAEQLTLKGSSLSAIGLGAVIAVFSLVGFESATSLGEEAKSPLQTIPAAVIWSVIIAGLFFVVCVYAEILGTRGFPTTLDKLTTPLNTLSDIVRAPYLKIPIDIGALFSSFSVALASLNGGARVIFTMGRSGLLSRRLGTTHDLHKSPHVALSLFALANFAVAALMLVVFRLSPNDAFNDTATLSAFGFVAIYLFIAVGAPFYLRRRGEMRPKHVALAVVTVLLLLLPAWGSVYPVPPAPANLFPYLFLAYFVIGAAWLWSRSARAQIVETDIGVLPAAETA
ncbi:MAG: APC family permease [Candidatus Eremiobacteraeota bacterium]|nr:APC family permease [Candidatus Eremiobacteraeota bacterium]